MTNQYLKLCGIAAATTLGKLDRYSEDHQKFLASGFVCQGCNATLMRWWGVADVRCLSESGERVSLAIARIKGKAFECPKCGHRWQFRDTS